MRKFHWGNTCMIAAGGSTVCLKSANNFILPSSCGVCDSISSSVAAHKSLSPREWFTITALCSLSRKKALFTNWRHSQGMNLIKFLGNILKDKTRWMQPKEFRHKAKSNSEKLHPVQEDRHRLSYAPGVYLEPVLIIGVQAFRTWVRGDIQEKLHNARMGEW